MAEMVSKIAIFVGSPGDVAEERRIVSQAVDDLNVGFASSRGMLLELKRWETHVWPGFGEDAQDVINDRVGQYDIFVGIFWNRFGTPSGRAPSGTAEEFERAYNMWKTHKRPALMLYFRRSPVDLSSLEDLQQKQQLLEFKQTLQRLGALFREYGDLEEFRRFISLHLMQELTSLEKSVEVQKLHERVDNQQKVISAQEQKLEEQQHVINQLVTYSMAEYIFKHLRHIYFGQKKKPGYPAEYIYRKNDAFEHDMRFLRDHGYIEFLNISGLGDGVNLVDAVKLTPVGSFYVKLRSGSEP
jgi:uncharacterized protein DUF4062